MSDLAAYDYELPRDLIAQQPIRHRTDARMMVVDRRDRSVTHAHIRDLPSFLGTGDCLVLNDTRVVPARLSGYRQKTGGRWSGLFLSADEAGHWQVMSKTRGKLRGGEVIVLQDRQARDAERLTMVAPQDEGLWIARPQSDADYVSILARVGRVPLPPYIRGGEMEAADVERYQTVFASQPGAIAAPTAGLHFTEQLIDQLRRTGVRICHVTLHVGVGTFRPVTAPRVEQHTMHGEWGSLDEATADALVACRAAGGRIVAAGTTCVRLLETAARGGQIGPWEGVTDLFIRPPYTFRAVDSLLTNFHLPRSTLLILVSAFGGDALIRRAYEIAVDERYRFYSYGDAMLIV